MRKYLFLFFIGLLPLLSQAQQRTLIKVQGVERATVVKGDNGESIIYMRKPVFLHDNAILTCDSAVLYEKRNVFEAYRNVHINQADTINIYSQRLTYDGNAKRAHLTENVRLLHRESILTTNVLDYEMAPKIGTYTNGGRIVSKDVKINSKNGYYFANSRDAYFRYKVVVVTDQSTINSDTLRYNTLTNETYFYGPTNIKGKDDNLYTENGTYNTASENAFFGKKSLYSQGSKFLKGDSLLYDGKKGYGRAIRNIVFIDTSDNMMLRGQLGEYYKSDERVVVTRNAFFAMKTDDSVTVNNIKIPDTLWLGADTLETMKVLKHSILLIKAPIDVSVIASKKKEDPGPDPAISKTDPKITNNKKTGTIIQTDTTKQKPPINTSIKKAGAPDSVKVVAGIGKPPAAVPTTLPDSVKLKTATPDSIAMAADTAKTRIIKAYHNVKLYKGNFQAKADSLFYADADSTMRWYGKPIMWAENSQQTGDTMYVQLKNRKLNSVEIFRNGFIVNVEGDSTKFNQIKGKVITGFFEAGSLRNMNVVGNAESIYFNKDKEIYKNMHQSLAGRIEFKFEDKKISETYLKDGSEGKYTPIEEVAGQSVLTGFIWKPELRPLSKEAVIGKPYKPPTVTPVKRAPVKKTPPKTIVKKT